MTAALQALSFFQRWVPGAETGAVVLAYHLVGGGTTSAVDIPVQDFVEQLRILGSEFEVVPLQHVVDGVPPATSKPPAVITFDDAFLNFYDVAYPLLSKHGLPSTLYVPVAFVSEGAAPPLRGASLKPCTWQQLREMREAGVAIESHSVKHKNLRRLSASEVDDELRISRAELEQRLGSPVTSFCYPQAKYDSSIARAAARHYRSAVVAGGRRYSGGDPLTIPRFPVRSDEPNFGRMVRSSLWLREALADRVRQWRS
jgi:peptidoglycan/xylan/chitin deacetylase (PgdA/CDA1 family)